MAEQNVAAVAARGRVILAAIQLPNVPRHTRRFRWGPICDGSEFLATGLRSPLLQWDRVKGIVRQGSRLVRGKMCADKPPRRGPVNCRGEPMQLAKPSMTTLSRSPMPAGMGELKPIAVAISLALGLGAGVAHEANAATITVNNLGGGSVAGQCTFSDAVQAANTDAAVQGCAAGAGADTILFSVAGTITLASTVSIDESVTISGGGTITLAPTGTNRIMYLDDTPPASVTLSGLTFAGNGTSTANGAAIFHYGGALTIQNCVFTGNATTGRGGAIFNYGGSVDIQSSTLSGNHANSRGGAIFMYSGALTMSDSTLTGNTAQIGGAIYFYNSSNATITNSTLSGNRATVIGGAISMYSTNVTLSNSTLSGNASGGDGPAVYLYASLLTLNSTIVANSTDLGGAPKGDIWDASGGTVDSTNSLIGNTAGFVFNVDVNNIKNVNPLLGPLANNGGPTQTMALLAGSPAIDAGANPLALAFDQRGAGFPRVIGAQTDIGAFEGVGAGPPPPPLGATPVPTLSQWGVALLSVLMAGWAMLTGFGGRRRS